jgi:hypothetical protein
MKNKLLQVALAIILIASPKINFAQAPALGAVASFVLFSSNGAVKNTSASQVTGDVGTNNGSNTGFGNVNGVMHAPDITTAKAAADLLTAYNQLKNTVAPLTHAPGLGGDTLKAGVYAIGAASTLTGIMTLNALNDPNAVFIFKINGPLSTGPNSKIRLINGALACNVFWMIEGLLDMASGSTLRGTLIVNNAGINMATGDTLEGRALTTTGALTLGGVMANTPIGCGSPVLTGPAAPNLGSAGCYAIFSANGSVSNSGTTKITGDVGTNVGLTTGYDPLLVNGTIHPKPDGSTAAAASDLLKAYSYLNTLAYDINLLYPAQFGNNLVLTPHTYLLDAATTFTGNVYLNGQGNANAVFVIKINGAIASSAYAKVILTNGTLEKNVYWKIEGAVNLDTYTQFTGTIVTNNGALGTLNTGVVLKGRALTTGGAITTTAMTATTVPTGCLVTGINSVYADANNAVSVSPNPFNGQTTLTILNASPSNASELNVYSILGALVMTKTVTEQTTTLDANLPSGIYYYQVINQNNKTVFNGKLVSQH